MNYVKHFIINGVNTKQAACIELHGKPNAATEGYVGVLGIDVDSPSHDVYKCAAVNGSIYTWELLSSGMSIVSANISGGGEASFQFPYDKLNTPESYIMKSGDLILDNAGHLYKVSTLDSTYCTADYCGTRLASDGDDGKTPHIQDGYWYIDETNLGVKAQGVDGANGKTPYILNGYWYIDGVNQEVKAQGVDGIGIEKIEKTSSEGLVDTYTITFTNGATTKFSVTNGKDGVGDGMSDADKKLLADLKEWMENETYVSLDITSFFISAITIDGDTENTYTTTIFEKGQKVKSVTFVWSYKDDKKLKLQKLENVVVENSAREKTIEYENWLTSDTMFGLNAWGQKDEEKSDTEHIYFYDGVYYGASAEPAAYDSAFILGLTKELSDSYLSSFSVNAGTGKYIYYCLPTSMGARKFSVGGFVGGFELVATIDFTNKSNHTESYYIYRSEQHSLGDTTVLVN